MAPAADIDGLVSSASREALERLVRAAAASGAISIEAIQKAVSGQYAGKPRVLGVIPARFGSTRFPGKPLAELGGKPMIWVRRRSQIVEQFCVPEATSANIFPDTDSHTQFSRSTRTRTRRSRRASTSVLWPQTTRCCSLRRSLHVLSQAARLTSHVSVRLSEDIRYGQRLRG